MTDRYSGLLITLDHNMRDDDAESLIQAIRHLRFVADVQPVEAGVNVFPETIRLRRQLAEQLEKLAIEIRQGELGDLFGASG